MKKIGIAVLCVIMIVGICCGAAGCKEKQTEGAKAVQEMDLLSKAMDIIQNNYIGEIDVDKLDLAAAEAVIGSLDKYTYLSSTLYSQTSDSSIGIYLKTSKYNEHFISGISSGLPADKTFEDGFTLQRGDELYGISNSNIVDDDGNPIFYRLRGLSNSVLSAYTAGDAGTVLTLRIMRDGVLMGDYAYTKEKGYMSRAQFFPDIFGDDSGVGYISLRNFTYTELPDGTRKSAADDFAACMTEFKQSNQTKLILDLRGNGGGSTELLSSIASYFVPLDNSGAREIVQLEYTKSNNINKVVVKENNYIKDLPLVILCDGSTASAAEALIGACRAFNGENTTVIGTETYGKGVFQSTAPITDKTKSSDLTGIVDQYYIVMVTGYYFILDPSHEGGKYNIHDKPLQPDIRVTPNETFGAIADDAEVIAARKVLLGE